MKHLTNTFNGNNQWYKYLGLFLASFIIGQFIGAIPLGILLVVKILQTGGMTVPSSENLADLSAFGIDPNLGFALMVFPFVICLIILLLLIKPMHKRSNKTLFSGSSTIRWKRFFTGTIIWFVLMAIYLIIDYSARSENYTLNFQSGTFAVLVIISLIFIPIQASYEEILFRGYLAQGVASWTKNRILVILLPAILFGSMHVLNPEVKEYGFLLVMPQYLLFGLVFGLISVLDDGIELAMGAHTANNLFLSLFVTNHASTLQTPAFFIQENIDPGTDLLVMLLISVVFIVIVSRIYKFDYSILTKKIEKEPVTEM